MEDCPLLSLSQLRMTPHLYAVIIRFCYEGERNLPVYTMFYPTMTEPKGRDKLIISAPFHQVYLYCGEWKTITDQIIVIFLVTKL